jgi:phospholipase C
VRTDWGPSLTSLDKVETIVLLMLENRSFDHLLGHLSYGT